MNALLTGLGIGIAFWTVVIPTTILLVRYPNERVSNDSLKLMEERNEQDKAHSDMMCDRLVEIRDALYHLNK